MDVKSAPQIGAARTRRAVLVVDDEVLVRMPVAETLRDEGLDVFEAASAQEALTILESAVVIDLVLTDVKMPGAMDGLGLARILRDRRPEVKIVVVSALLATPPTPDPADAFFLKPYNLADVADCVLRLLDGRADGG